MRCYTEASCNDNNLNSEYQSRSPHDLLWVQMFYYIVNIINRQTTTYTHGVKFYKVPLLCCNAQWTACWVHSVSHEKIFFCNLILLSGDNICLSQDKFSSNHQFDFRSALRFVHTLSWKIAILDANETLYVASFTQIMIINIFTSKHKIMVHPRYFKYSHLWPLFFFWILVLQTRRSQLKPATGKTHLNTARKQIRLIKDGDRPVPLRNYFSYFYNKSVFGPKHLSKLN